MYIIHDHAAQNQMNLKVLNLRGRQVENYVYGHLFQSWTDVPIFIFPKHFGENTGKNLCWEFSNHVLLKL